MSVFSGLFSYFPASSAFTGHLAMVAGGGGRDYGCLLFLDRVVGGIERIGYRYFMLLLMCCSYYIFPAKQPPPATVTMVAGGGGLMLCSLRLHAFVLMS